MDTLRIVIYFGSLALVVDNLWDGHFDRATFYLVLAFAIDFPEPA